MKEDIDDKYYVKKYIKCKRCDGTGQILNMYNTTGTSNCVCPDCSLGYTHIFVEEEYNKINEFLDLSNRIKKFYEDLKLPDMVRE